MTTDDIPAEVWKEYKNTGYKVSNHGRVIGRRGFILTPYRHVASGRAVVSLADSREEYGNRKVTACRMVLEMFGPPEPTTHHPHFRDNNPDNLHIDNLYWAPLDFSAGIRAAAVKKSARSTCKRNHPLEGKNLKLVATGRQCIACLRTLNKASYERTNHGKVWDEARIQLESDKWYAYNVASSTVEEEQQYVR